MVGWSFEYFRLEGRAKKRPRVVKNEAAISVSISTNGCYCDRMPGCVSLGALLSRTELGASLDQWHFATEWEPDQGVVRQARIRAGQRWERATMQQGGGSSDKKATKTTTTGRRRRQQQCRDMATAIQWHRTVAVSCFVLVLDRQREGLMHCRRRMSPELRGTDHQEADATCCMLKSTMNYSQLWTLAQMGSGVLYKWQ